jgi:predicted RNA-binding protein with PIN domain
VRVVAGGRDAGPCPAGNGELTPALDKLLRPAIEAAVAVARAGEDDTPAVDPPPALRPFLHFAKLPPRAVVAAQKAVDADDEFRARVAEAVTEDDIGRAGWLWLTRPAGWQDELDALAHGVVEAGEAAADRKAENEARRRLAGAEAATQRAEAAAAAAQAESARAAAVLAEERRARRAAAQEAEELGRRLEQATAERDGARSERDRARAEGTRAQQKVSELRVALDELRRTPAPAPVVAPEPEPDPAAAADSVRAAEAVRQAGAALFEAAGAAAAMATSLHRAAVSLGGGPPPAAPPPEPAPPARPRRPARPPRRLPVALPPGVHDDSVEAADHLFRVPGIAVLVDGYNASQLGWFEQPIAEQRRRLVDALTEMAVRTGADISVVFDGADPVWPALVTKTARVVKVSFSPADVEADDVVLARVADLDPSRPVLVASSDRRVADGARALGANVISSPQLLAALRR